MDYQGPPKWLDRFLTFYCKKSKLEDLQGDLWEFYDRNLEKKGRRWANVIYFIDVLKFMRIYTVQKPKLIKRMNFIALFNNYVKTSLRSIARNRLFSGINVIGLAFSMSVCLLMIAFISEVLRYDTFHENKERIFRVTSTYGDANNSMELASVPQPLLEELKKYPQIKHIAHFRRNFSPDAFLETGEVFQLKGNYATEGYFDVFSFPTLEGDVKGVLDIPYQLVVTESTAKKMFNDVSAVNQIIKIKDKNYTIKAVVQDPPKYSHIQFDFIASYITHLNQVKEKYPDYVSEWTNMWMYHTFVMLQEEQTQADFGNILTEISDRRNAELSDKIVGLYPQNIEDIVPGKEYSNEPGIVMDLDVLVIVSLLTLVVILTASFNYMNLSIAKSLRRAKEIGIRKVVGATRGQVFFQFIIEAVIISLIALIVAFGVFVVIKPQFLNLNDGIQTITDLEFTFSQALLFICFALIIGIVSGFLPAFLLSKLKAMLVLKDYTKVKLFSIVSFRKVLIVLQFTISLAFIISSTIIYQQYRYAMSYDLGFETENILNINTGSNEKSDQLAQLIEQIPEVKMISKSAMISSVGSIYTLNLKYKDPLDSVHAYHNDVDVNYIENLGHKLIAGSNFPERANTENQLHAIVNEALLKRFKMGTPSEAIGETITVEGSPVQIIGVVEDFMYTKIEGGIKPVIFRNAERYSYLNVKVESTDIMTTFDKLEKAWKEVDDIHAFTAEFYDDRIERAYGEYIMMFKIVSFLSVLAVSISILGLLGMAVYTTETRIKEISIRKVLGATEKSLVYLLSRGFLWMIGIAAIIAVPLTYLFFNEVFFSDYENHIEVGPLELLLGVLILFGIGFLVIGWQTLQAARSNPADTLRNE